MLIRIVGLNSEKFFYQVKECGAIGWKQYTKSIDNFIKMMFILFPELEKQSKRCSFITDKYSLAIWLYNYGETIEDKIKGKAYLFFYHR